MFARYYLYLDHPFADVWAVLLSHHPAVWPRLAGETGDELLTRAGVRLGGVPVYKRVRLELGSPYPLDRSRQVALPIRWHPEGGPPLFPDMSGELVFQPFGPDRTQMTLTANYQPPIGLLGALIDRAVLHLLADATVTDFSLRLAADLDRLLSPAAEGLGARDRG